jgi:hypothetical protein
MGANFKTLKKNKRGNLNLDQQAKYNQKNFIAILTSQGF